MTAALVGISGASRNACAAIAVGGEIVAACEQERLTRVRGAALESGVPPGAALDEVIALAGRHRQDVTTYVVAELGVRLPAALPVVAIDHHRAHAAAAYLTSPLQRAVVVVCDRHAGRELSVWRGAGRSLTDQRWEWHGPALATLYSEAAAIFEMGETGQEHRLEALAHLGSGRMTDRLRRLFDYDEGALRLERGWQAQLAALVACDRRQHGEAFEVAAAVQQRIGELLLLLLADVRGAFTEEAICLGGGLFYNTYFTTLVRQSAIFSEVFVPINPGNAGLAVGAALLAGTTDTSAARGTLSPFLGREYDDAAIKAALDSCKLSYNFVSEDAAVDQTVAALRRGSLVGWFQGRMEWGNRALGHRSILADSQSPYVLENLNCYLRKRERWRAFGISVSDSAVAGLAGGPSASPLMQYEYTPCSDRLRHVMPAGAQSVRVQTVPSDAGSFRVLHDRMKESDGVGALVNTSLNAFQEPIVRSPRDAIRVFYGTGLDMLVIGRFILSK